MARYTDACKDGYLLRRGWLPKLGFLVVARRRRWPRCCSAAGAGARRTAGVNACCTSPCGHSRRLAALRCCSLHLWILLLLLRIQPPRGAGARLTCCARRPALVVCRQQVDEIGQGGLQHCLEQQGACEMGEEGSTARSIALDAGLVGSLRGGVRGVPGGLPRSHQSLSARVLKTFVSVQGMDRWVRKPLSQGPPQGSKSYATAGAASREEQTHQSSPAASWGRLG